MIDFFDWQTWFSLAIVGVAILFMLRRSLRMFHATIDPQNTSCAKCPASRSQLGPRTIELHQLQSSAKLQADPKTGPC